MIQVNANNVDEYIAGFPEDIRLKLIEVRSAIRMAAPDAEESVSYGMPAYKLNGKPLVYFAGYRNHIGFYATPSGHSQFLEDLSKYKQGKGSVQFPVDEPMPLDMISIMVAFRVVENLAKVKAKRK